MPKTQKSFFKEEVPAIAKELLASLKGGQKNGQSATVLALSGDLGAGKTTLTQAIARELGIRENVVSPTFVIMKLYPIKAGRYAQLVHIDAYRLESAGELERLGWAELLSDSKNLILIEWPEKVPGAIPNHARFVELIHEGELSRKISF